MANHSHSTITFQWEPYIEKYILDVEPPFGELGKITCIYPKYRDTFILCIDTIEVYNIWASFHTVIMIGTCNIIH